MTVLNQLLASFKAGSELKGMVSVFQHLDSLAVNTLDAFTGDANGRNAAIDSICGILQSMKVPATSTTTTPPAA